MPYVHPNRFYTCFSLSKSPMDMPKQLPIKLNCLMNALLARFRWFSSSAVENSPFGLIGQMQIICANRFESTHFHLERPFPRPRSRGLFFSSCHFLGLVLPMNFHSLMSFLQSSSLCFCCYELLEPANKRINVADFKLLQSGSIQ